MKANAAHDHTMRLIVAVLGMFVTTSAAPVDNPMARLSSYQPSYATKGHKHACTVNETQACPLEDMSLNSSTMVYPGGSTRCIFSRSSPYAFQVIPGVSKRKIVIYFQGGGTCWDQGSTTLRLCTTDAIPDSLVGLFDHANPSNPYAEYTVLNLLYCSGDAHAGNITRPYTDLFGGVVKQSGYYNTTAALDWLRANIGDAPLEDLVLGGCSSGSIGVQTWAGRILQEFQAERRAFIADSFAGVFPPSSQGPTIKGYGVCDTDLLPAEMQGLCKEEKITLQDYVEHTIKNNPDVTFTVEGEQHCYTNLPYLYTADTISKKGSNSELDQTRLVDWVGALPLTLGSGNLSTACHGPVEQNANATGAAYCDQKLAGRTAHARQH